MSWTVAGPAPLFPRSFEAEDTQPDHGDDTVKKVGPRLKLAERQAQLSS